MSPAAKLVVLSALRWFPTGLVVPVLVLLLTSRGLSLAEVGQLMAVYSVVTLALELPTGGLADSWGRRPVVVGSALVQAAGLAALALFSARAGLVAGVVLLGVARALSSGPVEAWFVDVVQARGGDGLEHGLSRGQMAEALALGGGAVVGGFLPRVTTLPQAGDGVIALSVPFVAAAIMGVVYAGVAAALLTGDQRSRGRVGRTVVQAVAVGARVPGVRRLIVVAVCLGIILSGVELISPDRVAQLVGSPTAASAVFGVLTAFAFVVSAFGAWLSTRLPGRRVFVGAWAYLLAGALVLLLAVPWLGLAAMAYLAVYLSVGVQGPVTASLLHGRVESPMRSTMLSAESLALQAGGAMANLSIGWLVTHTGLVSGLAVLAAAGVMAFGVLWRDSRIL